MRLAEAVHKTCELVLQNSAALVLEFSLLPKQTVLAMYAQCMKPNGKVELKFLVCHMIHKLSKAARSARY